ncbi:cilia- and flagella-associated protein 43 [Contarinia nasturtii]|uniref:cilia- and flagella-associated protein 43 n=1 Tax=Contarinia nasturtii TaxID=265458 RepID=UPI0012D3E7C0|nr:cilia- and flagella-associated protein 43 [Contarinia nasturtii]
MAKNASKIIVWEVSSSVDLTFDVTIAHKTIFNLEIQNKISDVKGTFDSEGSLFIAHATGIWHINPSQNKIFKIINFQETINANLIPVISYKNGIVVGDFQSKLNFFKKSENDWSIIWAIDLNYTPAILMSVDISSIVLLSIDGIVDKLHEQKSNGILNAITTLKRVVKKCILINPRGTFLMLQTNLDEIIVVQAESGLEVSKYALSGVSCIESHETCSIVGVATSSGTILFLEIDERGNADLIAKYNLTSSKIVFIKFIPNSTISIAIDNENGLFAIKRETNNNEDIKKFIVLERSYLDYSMVKINGNLYALMLHEKCGIGSNESQSSIFDYLTIEETTQYSHQLQTIPMKNHYSAAQFQYYDVNKFILCARLTDIDIVQCICGENGKIEMNIQQTIPTTHLFGPIKFTVNASSILTFGCDGQIQLWDKNSMRLVKSVIAHDKFSKGVKDAIFDPLQRYLVTLSCSENVICFKNITKTFDFTWINAPFESQTEKIEIVNIDEMLESSPVESWKNVELARLSKEECENYKSQLDEMQQDLDRIKTTIVNYIDMNENEPQEEQFPIQFFNLNATEADIKSGALKEQIELEREMLEKTFADEKARIENIKRIIWDCFETKPQKVHGIFTDIFIQNFPLTALDEKLGDENNLIKVLENPELFAQICKLKPWIHPNIVSKEHIQWPESEIQSTKTTDRFSTFASKIIDQQLTSKVNLDYNFFSILPMAPENVDIRDEHAVNTYNIKIYHNIVRLKKLFNDMFVKMSKVKDNEMELMAQRNERLDQIHKDINLLQRLNADEITQFDPIQKCDYFKDDSTHSTMLAISTYNIDSQFDDISEQDSAKSLKTTRNQSFYERALDDMMDGVLQVCWEDELKKEPPKPPCMLQNIPDSQFTAAETAQIDKYREKITKIRMDRREYIGKLFEEKSALDTAIELMVSKLNRCLENIIKTKVKAQFAISSEQLKILTCVRDHLKFKGFCKKEKQIHLEKEQLKSELNNLMKIQQMLDQNVVASKINFEELTAKDQSLDKQFRTFFSDIVSAAVIDQAYRIFKRRPKGRLTTCQSSTILAAMIKRVNTINKKHQDETLLSDECIQYLQSLDANDKFSNAPNSIDQSAWNHLCKMRRTKIETEFKLRHATVILAEAESSLATNNKQLGTKRALLTQLDNKLYEVREAKENCVFNRKNQMVFKLGNIKIPLTGEMDNFDATTILSKSELALTNSLIQEAAVKKLKIKQQVDLCHRRVAYYEWKQSMLQMTIEDYKIILKRIEKCSITKDVKLWLHEKMAAKPKKIKNQIHQEPSPDEHKNDTSNTISALMKRIEQIETVVSRERKKNNELDCQIAALKVNIDERNIAQDYLISEKDIITRNERMSIILKRSKLVRKIQEQHAELLELSATLELQQLRTYPTLNVPIYQQNL